MYNKNFENLKTHTWRELLYSPWYKYYKINKVCRPDTVYTIYTIYAIRIITWERLSLITVNYHILWKQNKTILEITSVINDHGYESNYKTYESETSNLLESFLVAKEIDNVLISKFTEIWT